jgi:flavin-dependent dehydrogenase
MIEREEKFEVVVIGAGPAGLKAAEILAAAGKKVLVLEKSTEIGAKLCGGGLSSRSISLGISADDLGGKTFYRFKYHFLNQAKTISSSVPAMAIIERTALGRKMQKAALEQGVEIRLGAVVESVMKNCVVVLGRKINYDYLIGADGSNSLVRKFLKIPTKKLLLTIGYETKKLFSEIEIFHDRRLLGDGYGLIFPHKNYTQIGIASDLDFLKEKSAKKILDEWIAKEKINLEGQSLELRGSIINYDYQGFCFGNIFLAGDAAGFASGLNGEGIYEAIISGEEIAKKILSSSYKCPGIKHILRIKFFQEKILKKIMRIENRQLIKIIHTCLIILRKPFFYNLFSKIYPVPKSKPLK